MRNSLQCDTNDVFKDYFSQLAKDKNIKLSYISVVRKTSLGCAVATVVQSRNRVCNLKYITVSRSNRYPYSFADTWSCLSKIQLVILSTSKDNIGVNEKFHAIIYNKVGSLISLS